MGSYVKFGLRVSASSQTNSSVVSVYYADDPPSSGAWDSAAAFWVVPSLVGHWTSLIVRASGRHVSLYVDCQVVHPVDIEVARLPHGLTFNSGSTVYVAQGGPQFGQHFEVCTKPQPCYAHLWRGDHSPTWLSALAAMHVGWPHRRTSQTGHTDGFKFGFHKKQPLYFRR